MTIKATQVLKNMLGNAYICYLKTRENKEKGKTALKPNKQQNKPELIDFFFFLREGALKAAYTV